METKRPRARREVKRGALELAREDASLEAQTAVALDNAEIDMYLAMVRVSERRIEE